MTRLLCLGWLCLVIPVLCAAHHDDTRKPLPNAHGIPGTLMLCGQGKVPDAVLDHFVELARGRTGQIVVVQFGTKVAPLSKRIVEHAKKQKVAEAAILSIPSPKEANTPERLGALEKATGVWLVGASPKYVAKFLTGTALGKRLDAVRQRSGVLVGHDLTAAFASDSRRVAADGSVDELVGQDWLPEAIVQLAPTAQNDSASLKKLIKSERQKHVGYEIAPETALVVRGRRVYALGNGNVSIHLSASDIRPAKTIVLTQGRRRGADLTALRRSARVRFENNFPPKKRQNPVVEKGTLIIIGGGGMPKGLLGRFVKLAGGAKGHIVVFPTASPDPISRRGYMASALKRAGAGKVTVLPQRLLKDVESKAFLDTLKTATGIWFGGGRQWRFVDAYLDTKAHKLMHDVLKRGGVIGGSSAGASIQPEYMARGNPLGNLDIMAEGYERGLGFIKGVAVDQHFSQRRRQKDMTALVKMYPQILGIGIDEATAIIVQSSTADVVGRGRVFFYDTERKTAVGQPDYQAVAAGGRYDLKLRRVVKTP